MKKLLLRILVPFLLFSSSFTPSMYQNALLQRELAALNESGLTHRILDNGWVEIQNPRTGLYYGMPTDPLVNPRQPQHSGLPVLTVNLATIDTTQFSWKYRYMNTIPVTGIQGYELHSGDLDRNGKYEVYGIHHSPGLAATSVYEYNAGSNLWLVRYRFLGYTGNFGGVVENIDDIDQNGLTEIYARNADTLYVFEQEMPDSLPTRTKFRFNLGDSFGIPNVLHDMNSAGRKELIYRGGEPDGITLITRKTYMAGYDSNLTNFATIWSEQLPPGCVDAYCCSNISTGDFDGDGLYDFVTSSFTGKSYVVEHMTGNDFQAVWSDSLSTAARTASGDVDGNGIQEFFVGGTQAELDGYVHMRIYAYERVGDNQYQPFYGFNIFPVGGFYVDSYMTLDMDRDGRSELLVSFGGGVVIIKGDTPHQYSLFYYRRISSPDGASAADVTGDSIPELFTSHFYGSQNPYTQTDVFQLDSTLTGVKEVTGVQPVRFLLNQNYPNPFNPTSTIKYELPVDTHVSLKLFDLLGREVLTLVDEFKRAGYHQTTLNAGTVASGVYLCRLESGGFTSTKKLLLLK